MAHDNLEQLIQHTLEENKAADIQVLDVRELTDVTDQLIICSGISSRHVSALADKVVQATKSSGHAPLAVEQPGDSGWALIDFGDIVLHIMLPEVRNFYNLEKLWTMTETIRKSEP